MLELIEHALGLTHIEHGDGRVAIGTSGIGCQVNGRAAAGAIHGLNVLAQLLDLPGGKPVDEILFFQELEKGDEVAVIAGAAPVGEGRIALHIVGKVQDRRAVRTAKRVRKRGLGGGGMFADKLHELERGARGELKTFEMIKPERLAIGAHVEIDLPAQAGFEGHGGHFGGTTRAVHLQILYLGG